MEFHQAILYCNIEARVICLDTSPQIEAEEYSKLEMYTFESGKSFLLERCGPCQLLSMSR